MADRNYREEYLKFQATPEQKKARAKRNKNRRELLRKGVVEKGDGMDIDHKDGNPMNNDPKNLKVIPKSKNRAKR